MSIQIDGLTIKQVYLLDVMWNIQSIEDYTEWKCSLDHATRQQVEVLQELILIESMEELVSNTKDADQVIHSIQSKFDTK